MKKLLTIQDLMDFFQVKRSTIHRWVQAGHIPKPIKIGSTARWDADEIQKLLTKLKKK